LDRTTGPVQKGRKIVGRKISAPIHEKSKVSAPEWLRGEGDSALPAVERYFADRKGHRTNPVELDGELMAEIDSHWQPYAEAFGYH